MFDVPRPVVEFLARLLAAHRRRIGTPKGSRALGPFRQSVLVLRWFRDRTCVHCLARDAGISQATGYRYLNEAIDVLAEQCPDLHAVLEHCRLAGMTHVILDGTLIDCDRVAGTTERGNDRWYSGKGRRFAGNVQVIASANGTPLWVSNVSPGSVHDLTAARRLVLPALHTAIRDGLQVLADIGYIGAPGILLPLRTHPNLPQDLDADNQTYNTLLRCVRAGGERAIAELKQRWRALQYVTLSPNRIGAIVQAALVLNNTWRS